MKKLMQKAVLAAVMMSATLAVNAAEPLPTRLKDGQILGMRINQSFDQVQQGLNMFGPQASMSCAPLTDLPNVQRKLCKVGPIEDVSYRNQKAEGMELVFKDNLLTEVYLRFFTNDIKKRDDIYNEIARGMDKELRAIERRTNDSYLYFATEPYKSNVHKYTFEDSGVHQVTMGFSVFY